MPQSPEKNALPQHTQPGWLPYAESVVEKPLPLPPLVCTISPLRHFSSDFPLPPPRPRDGMAEVFGVVGSAVGCCDVILRATMAIARYIAEVKDMPEQLRAIRDELDCLESVTQAVQAYLQGPRLRRQPLDESAPIAALLQKCMSFVTAVKTEFDNTRQRSRYLFPLWTKERFSKVFDQLGRFTALLHLALGQDGWSHFFSIAEETATDMASLQDALKHVIIGVAPIADIKAILADLVLQHKAVSTSLSNDAAVSTLR